MGGSNDVFHERVMRLVKKRLNQNLRPWIWTGIFVIPSIVALFVYSNYFGHPRSEGIGLLYYNIERLEDFANSHDTNGKDSKRIIMIGGSTLKYATFDAPELETIALRDQQAHLRIIGLFNDRPVFRDFEPLTAQMPFSLSVFSEAYENLRYLKWQLLGTGPWSGNPEYFHAVQFERPCANNVSEQQLRVFQNNPPIIDPSKIDGLIARRFIQAAAEQGTKVVLLAVQKHPRFEKIRPAVAAVLEGLTKELMKSSDNIMLWRYPGQISAGNYCDLTHLNKDGRELFSDWLVSRLATVRLSESAPAGRRTDRGRGHGLPD
jgi:hypothetical protein